MMHLSLCFRIMENIFRAFRNIQRQADFNLFGSTNSKIRVCCVDVGVYLMTAAQTTPNKKVLLLHSDFYGFSCYQTAGLTSACSALCR